MKIIDKLSKEALEQVREYYDNSAKKDINDAITETHDFLLGVRKIGQKNPQGKLCFKCFATAWISAKRMSF